MNEGLVREDRKYPRLRLVKKFEPNFRGQAWVIDVVLSGGIFPYRTRYGAFGEFENARKEIAAILDRKSIRVPSDDRVYKMVINS